MQRLKISGGVVRRLGDGPQAKALYATAFEEASEALSHHARMSLAYKDAAGVDAHRHTLLKTALGYTTRLAAMIFAECNSEVSAERLKVKMEELDKYLRFSLSLDDTPEQYGSVPRNQREELKAHIGSVLATALKAKVNIALMAIQQCGTESVSMASTVEDVTNQCVAAYRALQDLMQGSDLDPKSRLEMCGSVWRELAKLGTVVDHFSLRAPPSLEGEDSPPWDRVLEFVNCWHLGLCHVASDGRAVQGGEGERDHPPRNRA